MQDLAQTPEQLISQAATGATPASEEEVLADRRDVKVKLPAAIVLRLYYLKLTTSLNYSDVVEEALVRYFAEVDGDVGAIPGLEPLRKRQNHA